MKKSGKRKTAGHTASRSEGWDGWLKESFGLGRMEHRFPPVKKKKTRFPEKLRDRFFKLGK